MSLFDDAFAALEADYPGAPRPLLTYVHARAIFVVALRGYHNAVRELEARAGELDPLERARPRRLELEARIRRLRSDRDLDREDRRLAIEALADELASLPARVDDLAAALAAEKARVKFDRWCELVLALARLVSWRYADLRRERARLELEAERRGAAVCHYVPGERP